MINVKDAYDVWSEQYDTNENKTRDLEALALREMLGDINFENCLEIGCGTGKNTIWLCEKAKHVTAVDLSNEMIARAKDKVRAANVTFQQADIIEPWTFANDNYDLVTFSLVLEHIENLEDVFTKIASVTNKGAHVYIGELHPFKQYSGSKARFETENGLQVVTCFNHHISDFTNAAKIAGFELVMLKEFFDEDNRNNIPRIIGLIFRKG